MSIDIGHALKEGLNRTLASNGVVLFVVFLVFGAVNRIAAQSVLATLLPQLLQSLQESSQRPLPSLYTQFLENPPPLAMSIPIEGAIALFFVMFVLGQTARVLSDRTFISDESQRLHEPGRWIVPATLSSIGGVIIIYLSLFILYLPTGIFLSLSPLLGVLWSLIALIATIVLTISFFFFRQEIASRDIGPVEALTDSWSLVSGDRLKVFLLAAVLYIVTFASDFVGSSLFALLSPIAGVITSIFIGAVFLVFNSAVAAQVYRQLRAEKRDVTETTDDVEDTNEAGDDEWEPDEKWNDPPL
jgi:hypothetical protein